MELVAILRVLSRLRLLVALGALVAVGLGVVVGGAAPSTAHVAWTRVMLDTPGSQLTREAPSGADTLTWRASLLASLTTTRPARLAIAGGAGLPAEHVAVVNLPLTIPPVATTLPVAALEAAAPVEPYVVTLLADQSIPMISIEASAFLRADATRLADSAARALIAGGSTTGDRKLQGIVVERAASVRVRRIEAGGGPIMAAVAAIAVFVLWCSALALTPGLARVWRATGAAERKAGRGSRVGGVHG